MHLLENSEFSLELCRMFLIDLFCFLPYIVKYTIAICIKSFLMVLNLAAFLRDVKEYEMAAKIVANASNETGRPLRQRNIQSYKEDKLSDEDEYLCKLSTDHESSRCKCELQSLIIYNNGLKCMSPECYGI